MAAPLVDLVLVPATPTVTVGDTFDITVQAQAGSQEVDEATIYLDFDPTKLEVQSITNGLSLPLVVAGTYNNTVGTVDHSVMQMTAPFPTGNFTVATVNFKALAADAGTVISFQAVSPRATDVARVGSSVLNTTNPGLP